VSRKAEGAAPTGWILRYGSTRMALTTFEIQPTEPQRGSVIWLHGLGSSYHAFEPVVPELSAPHLRFLFPSAPVRPLTISYGVRMPAWYDILSFAMGAPREDARHLVEITGELTALMDREHQRGVAYENIVLAGFSQGGAMALHAGLRSSRRLAGLLVMSAYLPASQRLQAEAEPARKDTPILFCHGRRDGVVPHSGGRLSYTLVKQAGFTAEWAEFDVEHTMNAEEIHFIGRWLAARFPGGLAEATG
jgi:phospholipase/carboxylesterase